MGDEERAMRCLSAFARRGYLVYLKSRQGRFFARFEVGSSSQVFSGDTLEQAIVKAGEEILKPLKEKGGG